MNLTLALFRAVYTTRQSSDTDERPGRVWSVGRRVLLCASRRVRGASYNLRFARWFGRRSRGIPPRIASGSPSCQRRCHVSVYHASGNMPMRKSDVPCGTSSTSSA